MNKQNIHALHNANERRKRILSTISHQKQLLKDVEIEIQMLRCEAKLKFPNRSAAETYMGERDLKQFPYDCPHCEWWHLSKKAKKLMDRPKAVEIVKLDRAMDQKWYQRINIWRLLK